MSGNRHNLPTRSAHYPKFLELAREWRDARIIAARLGVSTRTVYRFAELARREGRVVRSHQGVGGGIQVMPLATCSIRAGYQRPGTAECPPSSRGAPPVLAGGDPEGRAP